MSGRTCELCIARGRRGVPDNGDAFCPDCTVLVTRVAGAYRRDEKLRVALVGFREALTEAPPFSWVEAAVGRLARWVDRRSA